MLQKRFACVLYERLADQRRKKSLGVHGVCEASVEASKGSVVPPHVRAHIRASSLYCMPLVKPYPYPYSALSLWTACESASKST